MSKKPHLFFRKGYWCVSPKPKPYWNVDRLWRLAYDRKMLLNYRVRANK